MSVVDMLYRANGESQMITPKNGTDYSLKEMQDYVGGYIELIASPLDGEEIIVLNEEGKLKDLPVNETATGILHKWGYADIAVGDVMVVDNMRIK